MCPNLGHTILMNISVGARLHPVSAVSWSGDFNAGYLAGLDATAVEIPLKDTLKTINHKLKNHIADRKRFKIVSGTIHYFIVYNF